MPYTYSSLLSHHIHPKTHFLIFFKEPDLSLHGDDDLCFNLYHNLVLKCVQL